MVLKNTISKLTLKNIGIAARASKLNGIVIFNTSRTVLLVCLYIFVAILIDPESAVCDTEGDGLCVCNVGYMQDPDPDYVDVACIKCKYHSPLCNDWRLRGDV